MIINAGIKNFIGNNEDGSIAVYKIENWTKDWKKLDDLTKDREKYKTNYDKKKK